MANTWFSGILLLLFLMAIAFLGYVLPFGQMSFWGATVITNLLSPFPCLIEWVCGGYCVHSPTLKRFFLFHFVLSLGAVIAIFSGIIFNGEKIVGSKSLLPSPSSTLSLYHLDLTFVGILLTFSPMHFLGFNVMPRRIPDFPDSF